jgi:hypothetical protein
MIDAKLKDLMTRDVDGLLTDEEQSRLARSLRRSKEARAAHDDQLRLAATLAQVSAADPPVHLANRIRHALHSGETLRPAGTRQKSSIAEVFAHLLHFRSEEGFMTQEHEHASGRPKRSILIGAGVVAICAVVYFSYQTAPPSADSVSGTIGAAKKYRSEQISDKDVQVGEPASGVALAKDPADDNVVTELKKTAAALGTSARDLGSRPGFDRTLAAELGRTAAELEKTAQAVLDRQVSMEKSVAGDLQRQAVELNRTAELARTASLDRAAAADFRKNTGILERAALEAQPALERSAAAEFARTSASLERIANDLSSRAGYDRAAVAELQKTAGALNRAAQYSNTSNSLDRGATADLMQKARDIERSASTMTDARGAFARSAAAEFGQRAHELQKQTAGFERSASASLGRQAAEGR